MLQARDIIEDSRAWTPPAAPRTDPLAARYRAVRAATVALAHGLPPALCDAQSMEDCSPVKWHLAHTTWFFETFVLDGRAGYRPYAPEFRVLFNSYYDSVGPQHPRPRRGEIARPTLDEVLAYRAHVDAAMERLLGRGGTGPARACIELGLAHEEQHQELVLTDLKHLLAQAPGRPAYRPGPLARALPAAPARWIDRPGGLVEIGQGGTAFAFDNERPRHRHWLEPHALASRLVTVGAFREFIRDGGYRTPTLWLADGWLAVQREGWSRPLYWSEDLASHFTLRGEVPLDDDEPVCHISYYEAEAYARWAGARLPREQEWEAAAAAWPVAGNFADSGRLHPRCESGVTPEFYGNVWEWTASPYTAYPGYRSPAGALGEYNGKFMCNQMVLRGGSCASPPGHLRAAYRNFFSPHARWQFSGVRLARDRT
jgi:ergothioneine biosynthesis protein EgtB